jgi:hypothetical protein
MNKLQIGILAIVLIILSAFCQNKPDPKKILSNKETRKEIIEIIAIDIEMMNETMEAMMNGINSKRLMMHNHLIIMKMMKNNPGMMENMMSDMMESCKGDTSKMSYMCRTMMGNKQMREIVHKLNIMHNKKH